MRSVAFHVVNSERKKNSGDQLKCNLFALQKLLEYVCDGNYDMFDQIPDSCQKHDNSINSHSAFDGDFRTAHCPLGDNKRLLAEATC